MTFEGEPSEMSEAGELPIPDADDDESSEGGAEETGGGQDSEQAEADEDHG